MSKLKYSDTNYYKYFKDITEKLFSNPNLLLSGFMVKLMNADFIPTILKKKFSEEDLKNFKSEPKCIVTGEPLNIGDKVKVYRIVERNPERAKDWQITKHPVKPFELPLVNDDVYFYYCKQYTKLEDKKIQLFKNNTMTIIEKKVDNLKEIKKELVNNKNKGKKKNINKKSKQEDGDKIKCKNKSKRDDHQQKSNKKIKDINEEVKDNNKTTTTINEKIFNFSIEPFLQYIDITILSQKPLYFKINNEMNFYGLLNPLWISLNEYYNNIKDKYVITYKFNDVKSNCASLFKKYMNNPTKPQPKFMAQFLQLLQKIIYKHNGNITDTIKIDEITYYNGNNLLKYDNDKDTEICLKLWEFLEKNKLKSNLDLKYMEKDAILNNEFFMNNSTIILDFFVYIFK